jgi:hypothetical protein
MKFFYLIINTIYCNVLLIQNIKVHIFFQFNFIVIKQNFWKKDFNKELLVNNRAVIKLYVYFFNY